MWRTEKRIKLGVLGDEFFDLRLGGFGGFGWAMRMLAECFNNNPELGVDLVFFTNRLRDHDGHGETTIHDSRLVLRGKNRAQDFSRLRAEKLDLLLLIDYNLGYRFHCLALPRTPIILWVRDPWTPEDTAEIMSVRVPGQENVAPQGISPNDCTSVSALVQWSRWIHRPFLFAATSPDFSKKLRATFGIEQELHFLPNIIRLDPDSPKKSERPTVVFLARLDPYKRPWVAAQVARHFPQVEFLFLGHAHYRGAGAWEPSDLPPNVRLMGHVDGEQKIRVLSSAWVLINTSIHEGLAVSFLEALACETPLLSCEDPGGVVSRFGIHAGHWRGTGLGAVPALVEGLEKLLRDDEWRARLGKAGRAWVNATHNEPRFLESFFDLCERAGVVR